MKLSFHSIHHPEGLPPSHVVGHALVRPVAACVVPVMIAATVAVLQWTSAWPFFSVGLPIALGIASLWTHFDLHRKPAVLHLRPGQAAIQSVYDVMRDRSPDWRPLLDARLSHSKVNLTLGLSTLTIERSTWPEFDAVEDAVRDMRHAEPAVSYRG